MKLLTALLLASIILAVTLPASSTSANSLPSVWQLWMRSVRCVNLLRFVCLVSSGSLGKPEMDAWSWIRLKLSHSDQIPDRYPGVHLYPTLRSSQRAPGDLSSVCTVHLPRSQRGTHPFSVNNLAGPSGCSENTGPVTGPAADGSGYTLTAWGNSGKVASPSGLILNTPMGGPRCFHYRRRQWKSGDGH
jgi:hypothetical protein